MISAFDEFIRDLYEKWLQEHQGQGVFNLKEAWEEIWPIIKRAFEDGGIVPDIEASAYNALTEADRKLTDRGKRLLKKEWGKGQASLDDGDWLTALIALGDNDRVQFGDMGFDEYTRADELRYHNLRAVQDEYNEWRNRIGPFVRHMRTGLTVREIIDQGLINPTDFE